jgi:hypothetical protein
MPRKGDSLPPADNQHHFRFITNSNDQHVLLAPLSVPLSELFTNIDKSYREVIQSYCFNDRALEMDDDKELDIFMKRGAKMMNLDHEPDPQDWFTLFENAYVSLEPEFADPGNGDDMRDFGLNLAASDPLTLFDHSEFVGEGNLFPSYLAVAWLGATALLGWIHLFYDVELQTQCLAAQTFDNMHEENNDYSVPTEGLPLTPWNDLSPSEQHNSQAFTYSFFGRSKGEVKKPCGT